MHLGENSSMYKKYLFFLSSIIIFGVSACGSTTEEPTISAEAIAQTAAAEAWLAVTQTQAALPTATIQPTSTPEPTITPAPTLPPLPTLSQATPVSVATIDPCNQVPPIEPKGKLVKIEIRNDSQGSANLALGMNSPNDFDECVTYSFEIGKTRTIEQSVLTACYWGYAWINGAEVSTARTGGTLLCLTDASQTYRIKITKETIEFY